MGMPAVSLKVLTSPGCMPCHEFLEFWNAVARDWPQVEMSEHSVISVEGQAMAIAHRVFASPGIIVNDELFAMGGFDRDRLLEKLRALSGSLTQ